MVQRMRDGAVKAFALIAGTAAISGAGWQSAKADGIDWSLAQLHVVGKQPALSADAMTPMVDAGAVSNFIAAWQARAAQVRANQPAWSSPLITTTGMLEQRFRFDLSEQHAGNGANTTG